MKVAISTDNDQVSAHFGRCPLFTIIDIEDGSSADRSGLRVGDVIFKIEKKKIRNKADFKSVTSKIKGNCLLKTNRGFFVIKSKGKR